MLCVWCWMVRSLRKKKALVSREVVRRSSEVEVPSIEALPDQSCSQLAALWHIDSGGKGQGGMFCFPLRSGYALAEGERLGSLNRYEGVALSQFQLFGASRICVATPVNVPVSRGLHVFVAGSLQVTTHPLNVIRSHLHCEVGRTKIRFSSFCRFRREGVRTQCRGVFGSVKEGVGWQQMQRRVGVFLVPQDRTLCDPAWLLKAHSNVDARGRASGCDGGGG